MGDEPQAPATPETPTQPSGAQKRINELYGKYKQAEEQTAAFEAQNAELRTQLASMQEEITSLKSATPSPPPADPFAQPVVNTGTTGAAGLDIEKIVSTAVERAVGPFIAESKQRSQLQQLQAAQRASFQKAAQSFPGLGDPQSELNKAAAEILKLDKYLQAHPDGPFLAAAAAQGFLTPPAQAPTPEQKLLAVQQPAGAGVPTAEEQKDTPKAIEKRMDELMALARSGIDPDTNMPLRDTQTRDIWFEYRSLQQKLAQAAKEESA